MTKPIKLIDTKDMDEKTWLECRAHGPKGDIEYTVGGSNVAAIFGVSPWMTPLELWLIKKGRMKEPAKNNPDQLEMGHMLEPIAAHWFEKKTGYKVFDDSWMYQHADFPYCLANFDRRYIRPDGVNGILECKSTTYHKAKDWANNAVPLFYDFQLRFYLGVDDTDNGAFSCIWGNNPNTDLAKPEIVRDKSAENIIFEKLEQWNWSLIHDKPPTMQGVDPSLALTSLGQIYGSGNPALPARRFTRKYEEALRQIATLQTEISSHKEEVKNGEKEMQAYCVQIAEVMQNYERGVLETTDDSHAVVISATETDASATSKTDDSVAEMA